MALRWWALTFNVRIAASFLPTNRIDLERPTTKGDYTWTVRADSASTPFSQKLDSLMRKTAKGSFPSVHDTTTASFQYLVFANSSEAQDAYAYFLYHKQLGQ